MIFALPGNERLAGELAERLAVPLGHMDHRRFPDGETYLRLVQPVDGRDVLLVCTLDRPDEKVLPLLFAAAAARELGARRVALVAPYLAYMRQDKRFHPGEAVTSTYFGRLLSQWIDGLVTVDPHLHRHDSLSEVYAVRTVTLHAAPAIADWIRAEVENPVLIGPDSESAQWVGAVAEAAGAPFTVLRKTRRGDRDVEVSVPDIDRWRSRVPVLVDDIISSARTMIATVRHVLDLGLPPPVCVGVHAVFAKRAYEDLLAVGPQRVVTCNTIGHPSNAIDLTGLLADGAREVLG